MVVLLLLPMSAALAQSIETIEVTGRVEHGAEGATFDPTQVRVTLNVLEGMQEGITSISQDTVVPEADGSFRFEVAFTAGRTLFFTIDYQGAVYSVVRDAESLNEPVVITVFDSTHDTSVLTVASYTLFITGADAEQGFIELLERAVVRNDSNLTLAPDQEAQGPAMLSFMRFALPPNAYNLDVRSNLVGGQVLEVDRGFALTTPIPPTPDDEPHQFEFVYRLDYDERSLDLSRTMRFGAGSFRFVVPVDVGTPASPRLDDLGATDFNGRLLRLLEGSGHPAGGGDQPHRLRPARAVRVRSRERDGGRVVRPIRNPRGNRRNGRRASVRHFPAQAPRPRGTGRSAPPADSGGGRRSTRCV